MVVISGRLRLRIDFGQSQFLSVPLRCKLTEGLYDATGQFGRDYRQCKRSGISVADTTNDTSGAVYGLQQ